MEPSRSATGAGKRSRKALVPRAPLWPGVVPLGLVVAAGLVGWPSPATGQGGAVEIRRVDPSEFPVIRSFVNATDAAGRPLVGLSATELAVTEDGKPPSRVDCVVGRPSELSLAAALVIDCSGSMRGAPLDNARGAAADFVSRLGPNDRCALIGFAAEVRDAGTLRGPDPAAVSQLARLAAGGDTALYDALMRSVERLKSEKADRKAIVALTDGRDTISRASRADAIHTARDAGISLYLIGLGNGPQRDVLGELAEATGGRCFFTSSPADLVHLYRSVLHDIETYYVLSYRSPQPGGEPAWRQVGIELRSPDARGSDMAQYQVPSGIRTDAGLLGDLRGLALPAGVAVAVLINLVLLVALVWRTRRRR